MDVQLPNWEILQDGLYVVRTQAGFRQAVKNFWGSHAKGQYLKGYPTSYPSLVHLSNGYCGYEYCHANCIPLNQIRRSLDKHADIYSEA